ncbi:unnamed protein product [Ectocarpus sp. 13 AM-2016]
MAAPAGRRKLNIVVEGCCHGELPAIYASVLKMEQHTKCVCFCLSRGAWKPARNFLA